MEETPRERESRGFERGICVLVGCKVDSSRDHPFVCPANGLCECFQQAPVELGAEGQMMAADSPAAGFQQVSPPIRLIRKRKRQQVEEE